MQIKKDIENIEDIKILLDDFYSQVLLDETIGFVFNDIAQINLATHMPKMYSFWDAVLFGSRAYNGNPILTHIELNKKITLKDDFFTQWKKLFFATIDKYFEGKIANLAKEKTIAMEYLMKMKIDDSSKKGFIQ